MSGYWLRELNHDHFPTNMCINWKKNKFFFRDFSIVIFLFLFLLFIHFYSAWVPVRFHKSLSFYVGMGTAVAQWLRCYATNRKVAGSIPDGVIGIFHWHNPSDRIMALGSTQPLTEMSARSISWGWMRPVCKADILTNFLCRCHEIWEP